MGGIMNFLISPTEQFYLPRSFNYEKRITNHPFASSRTSARVRLGDGAQHILQILFQRKNAA